MDALLQRAIDLSGREAIEAVLAAVDGDMRRLEMRLEADEFERNHAMVLRNMETAEKKVLSMTLRVFVVYIDRYGPADTNRFKRAYPIALHVLGLGPFPVPAVVPGRCEANRRRLVNQYNKWAFIAARYEKQGRTHYKGVKKSGMDKGYQRAKRLRVLLTERVNAGLLSTNGAYDFMSLLGALSLIGLLIKNAIVLIEESDQQIDEGKNAYDAILDSGVSRLRPVILAAATTILGLIPLLSDVFFVNMSVTIMAGLGFASVLTLIVVPTLYALFYRVEKPTE